MKYWIIAIIISLGVIIFLMMYQTKLQAKKLTDIQTPEDIYQIFPQSVKEINFMTNHVLAELQANIDHYLSFEKEDRTWENTAQLFDYLAVGGPARVWSNTLSIVHMLYPDDAMRQAAQDATLKMHNFFTEHLFTSLPVYQAWQSYIAGNALQASLSDEQKYFIHETEEMFRRHGLQLSEEKRKRFQELEKEIAATSLSFGTNIAQDNKTIEVDKNELVGLSDDFINSLKKTPEGKYILGMDYPTLTTVLNECETHTTRKNLWLAYHNRAYPGNKKILEKLIALRDEMAQLLGFESYAAYDLDNQMVQTVARAESFLHDLNAAAVKKEKSELDELMAYKPASIEIKNNQFYPWDMGYVKNRYKKEKLQLDEAKIAEYFPMESTVAGLLSIYESFFQLKFKQIPFQSPWQQEVTLLAVYDAQNTLLGYFILDLYPRANKYSHACHADIILSLYKNDGKPNVALSVVIANFSKSTATKPSLLKFNDVSTFFHEFGHALHALLGRTSLAAFSGTSVKLDFVEMPSQMLEEWLYDKEILQKVSAHYQTKQPLPNDLINGLLQLKKFDSGQFITRQCFLSQLSLDLYKPGTQKNLDELYRNLYERMRTYSIYIEQDHMYASFGHLPEYGPRYYGYMWSRVFASDLFNTIKKEGLLNPVIGSKYASIILAPGSSKDPNILLKEFLGRSPNQDAFLRDLGFNS